MKAVFYDEYSRKQHRNNWKIIIKKINEFVQKGYRNVFSNNIRNYLFVKETLKYC